MILRCVLAAAIGFVQVALIVTQTKMVAAGRTGWPIFAVSVGISGIWCAGVLSIVSRPIVAIFYVAAAATGAATAARIRVGGKTRIVPRRHLLPDSLRDARPTRVRLRDRK